MKAKMIEAISGLLSKAGSVHGLVPVLTRNGIGSYAECYEMVVSVQEELTAACEDNGGDCFFCKFQSSCAMSER